jgi:hypothetical protein
VLSWALLGVVVILCVSVASTAFAQNNSNTVLEQAERSLAANQKKSSVVSPEPVPIETPSAQALQEIKSSSMVGDVFFTWIIISSDNEVSVNLRYVGEGSSTPPISLAATASTNGQSATKKGNSDLNAGWISPHTEDISLDGDSSLYDSTSIDVVASPVGSSPPTSSPPTSPSASPSPSPAIVQSTPASSTGSNQSQSKTEFTNSNYVTLFAKPDSYLDSTVDFTGKISNFPGAGVLQMYPGGGTNDVVVYYNETFNFLQGECVKVTGVVRESFAGTNAFGATRIVPAVAAQTIDKVDCSQAVDPALKTVVVEKSQIKGGIKVTMHKVEFSDKNTRAYLTVENTNQKASITFYDFNSKALQGKKQYSTTYSYETDYPKIESDIPPGIEETGIVLFEPLNYNVPTARFQFQAAREDNYASFDFVFPITIPR